MKRRPSIHNIVDILTFAPQCEAGITVGDKMVYVPARPLGGYFRWERLRATWLVWTGRADALVWPGQ